MQFSAKFGQIVSWRPTLGVVGNPFWEILDPLLLNNPIYENSPQFPCHKTQWWIQDFLEGVANTRGGVITYHLAIFMPKIAGK